MLSLNIPIISLLVPRHITFDLQAPSDNHHDLQS